MIDKIDIVKKVNLIDNDGCIVYDRDYNELSRPMNNLEIDMVDKINELVDKFNEVFPL